jgi:hypothetical protein
MYTVSRQLYCWGWDATSAKQWMLQPPEKEGVLGYQHSALYRADYPRHQSSESMVHALLADLRGLYPLAKTKTGSRVSIVRRPI